MSDSEDMSRFVEGLMEEMDSGDEGAILSVHAMAMLNKK